MWKARAAVADAGNVILHETWLHRYKDDAGNWPVRRIERWIDQTDLGADRLVVFDDTTGKPVLTSATRLQDGKRSDRFIDFNGNAYWDDVTSLRPGVEGNPLENRYEAPLSAADDLRKHLGSGGLRQVSRTTVDGRDTLVLHKAAKDGLAERRVLVDAETFLPVEITQGSGTARGELHYEWLPRTPAQIAELWPEIPAGASELPKPTIPQEFEGFSVRDPS